MAATVNGVSLRYTLMVTGPPYGTQQASSAYQFSQACIAAGHHLCGIFFYHAGVMNANRLTAPASDEFDLVAAWQALSKQHGVVLLLCVSAALRRGVMDEQEALQRQLGVGGNLTPGFSLSGLTALAEAAFTTDRMIQF